MKKLLYLIYALIITGFVLSCNEDEIISNNKSNEFSLSKDIDDIVVMVNDIHNSRSDIDVLAYLKDKLKSNSRVLNISEYYGKYLINMANEFDILIDLNVNNTHSTKLSTAKNKTQYKELISRGWGADSIIKDQNVLIWSPFNDSWSVKMTDSLIDVFNNYIGSQHITTIVDYDCDRYSVSEFSDYGMIIIDTHGAEGKYIFTRDTLNDFDKLIMDISPDYYRNQGLYINQIDNELSKYWMVSPKWLDDNMGLFEDYGRYLIFNGSCTSADSEELKNMFFQKQADIYIGFKGLVPVEHCASYARHFFINFFKNKHSCKKSIELINDTTYAKYWHLSDVDEIYYTDNIKSDSLILYNLNTKYNIGWNITEPISAWNGVLINNNRVYNVDLSYKNLSGTLDSNFFHLTAMNSIKLNDNNLTGGIPDNIDKCPNLIYMDLSNNSLSGNIPYSLKPLYDKEYGMVFLTGNNLSGQIPFGTYNDQKLLFSFDSRYSYDTENEIAFDYGNGLYYADEPIFPVIQ